MHRPLRHWIFFVGCAAGLFVCGCGSSREEADVEETELTELSAEPGSTPEKASPGNSAPPPATPAVTSAPAATQAPPTTPVGLIKTVVQQLRQRTPDGWTDTKTTLELTFLLTPDEARPVGLSGAPADPRSGQQRFQVKYQRVRVMQETAGEQPLVYDSNTPPQPLHPAFLPYHAMNKNGFEFWLDRDRQLVDVVGFDQFLNRCLEPVAPEDRASARALLPATSPMEGMACFVDESVGLIPPEAQQPGATWMKSHQVIQPVAMTTTTRYTLQPIDPETADVDISGSLTPFAGNSGSGGRADPVQVTVRGGQIIGKCRIDRRSGLPLGSRVEQLLEMTVRLPGGGEFDQFKITSTTVECPNHRSVLPSLTLSATLPTPSFSNPPPRVDSGIDGDARRR